MKAGKILLFIFSVIALLAVLCSFFPREGVVVGPWTLEFPSLADMLADPSADEPEESPEELLERRLAAIETAQRNEYLEYFRSDPARFHFPDDDYHFLDSLFEAFEAAEETPMRIVHYGDSQIEMDRVSCTIRDVLQERFGGCGPGLQPVLEQGYSGSVGQSCTKTMVKQMAFGPEDMRADHKKYGPMCQLTRLDSVITVSFYPRKQNTAASRKFDKVNLLIGNFRSPVSISYGGQHHRLEKCSGDTIVSIPVAKGSERVSFTLSGNADIYGVQLDGDKGLTVDNVPMRGCSGTIFTRVDSDQLRRYYRKNNVRLIILQYGGNTVPYMKTEKQLKDYAAGIERQIKYLKSLAPDASFIFIGPSDMATSIGGKMQTYPMLPTIVDSLKSASNRAGAAFWDMYGAMGGHDSMVRWVQSNPPLAGGDYVHFTPRGAQKMGDMFSKSMMLYYDYYKWDRSDREYNQSFKDSLMNLPEMAKGKIDAKK